MAATDPTPEPARAVFRSRLPEIEIPDVALPAFVLEHAARWPEAPALTDAASGRSLRFGELADAVPRFAAGLAARGIGCGDVVALLAPNVPEYPLAYHGTAHAGATVSTVNVLYAHDELVFQLRDAGARLLVTVPALLGRARAAAAAAGIEEVVVLGEADGATPLAALLAAGAAPPRVAIDPATDVVALPYSSGTSGLPKGVCLTHRNIVANVCQTAPQRVLGPDDRLVAALPFSHIYGQTAIMNAGLRFGAEVVALARYDLDLFLRTVHERRITMAYLVPPIVAALAREPQVDRYDLSSLRFIVSGAAALPAGLAEACHARIGVRVVQGYGMTEVSSTSHMVPERARNRPGSIGLLVPNMEARIVDLETDDDVPPGAPGELLLRGPNVTSGYRGHAAPASAHDADGFLRTGDVVTVDEDGWFRVVDRCKELIKVNGYQVAPAELEAVLHAHADVADCCVVGRPDDATGEAPVAVVVLAPGARATAEALAAHVAARVAPYKRLRAVALADAIPRTPSGKLVRRVLVEQLRAESEGSAR